MSNITKCTLRYVVDIGKLRRAMRRIGGGDGVVERSHRASGVDAADRDAAGAVRVRDFVGHLLGDQDGAARRDLVADDAERVGMGRGKASTQAVEGLPIKRGRVSGPFWSEARR